MSSDSFDYTSMVVLAWGTETVCALVILYAALGAFDRRFPFTESHLSPARISAGVVAAVLIPIVMLAIPSGFIQHNPFAIEDVPAAAVITTIIAAGAAYLIAKLNTAPLLRLSATLAVSLGAYWLFSYALMSADFPKTAVVNPYFDWSGSLAHNCVTVLLRDDANWEVDTWSITSGRSAHVGESTLVRANLVRMKQPESAAHCASLRGLDADAHLSMTGGRLETIDDDPKLIDGTATEWAWRITPTEPGDQYLNFELFLAKPGHAFPNTPALSIVRPIKVTGDVWLFLQSGVPYLISLFIAVAAALAQVIAQKRH